MAVTSRVRDIPAGELTPEQVAILVRQLTAIHQHLTAVIDMMSRYADAGGRDWETWDRLLDGLGRAGTKLMQYAGDPVHPDWIAAAQHAIAEAAGPTVKDGVLPETVHRKLAEALLTTVWRSGSYFLVSPTDWPDLLPAVVLGAVRSAPHINDDALMDRLRDDGDPGFGRARRV
jgi:hypothetical protein